MHQPTRGWNHWVRVTNDSFAKLLQIEGFVMRNDLLKLFWMYANNNKLKRNGKELIFDSNLEKIFQLKAYSSLRISSLFPTETVKREVWDQPCAIFTRKHSDENDKSFVVVQRDANNEHETILRYVSF
ncbi:hypothetical protein RFI_07610 [Reticulomyxa filosa]|uniref:DM2 domain-containing protein n=1 Tax=Reticulomyxa filosa TaxID=46433 RepID=X6NUP4_RETFI|nr:hypothetical protein RFI_07610 [Reticulomyxa filosa]|eukprot:ETO29509.1 hypothetical protein RFI_07610 [Reticulomyxa filosa]